MGETEQELSVSLEELGYEENVALKELWTKETSSAEALISATIAPHACMVYQVSRQ
ncbi:MAG: hypothetical protein K2L18_11680 [Acetatifactor sp.]|nr:hypothetical protein [Acetatifactor sp.]